MGPSKNSQFGSRKRAQEDPWQNHANFNSNSDCMIRKERTSGQMGIIFSLHPQQNHLLPVHLVHFPADVRLPGQLFGGFFLKQDEVAAPLAEFVHVTGELFHAIGLRPLFVPHFNPMGMTWSFQNTARSVRPLPIAISRSMRPPPLRMRCRKAMSTSS